MRQGCRSHPDDLSELAEGQVCLHVRLFGTSHTPAAMMTQTDPRIVCPPMRATAARIRPTALMLVFIVLFMMVLRDWTGTRATDFSSGPFCHFFLFFFRLSSVIAVIRAAVAAMRLEAASSVSLMFSSL